MSVLDRHRHVKRISTQRAVRDDPSRLFDVSTSTGIFPSAFDLIISFCKGFFFSSFPLSLGIVMAVKEKPLLPNNIENRQKQRKKGKLFCISNQETDVCVSRIWLKNSLTYKEMENTSSRCASRNRTGGVLPGTGYQIFVFLSTCVWLCEQTNRKWKIKKGPKEPKNKLLLSSRKEKNPRRDPKLLLDYLYYSSSVSIYIYIFIGLYVYLYPDKHCIQK